MLELNQKSNHLDGVKKFDFVVYDFVPELVLEKLLTSFG
jgi:hypothetical protein